MEFPGTGHVATAKRLAYGRILEACGGDTEIADGLIGCFADGTPPTLADLRMVAAHAWEVTAEIEAERGEQ
jgi:hypothetical protein